MNFFTDKDMDSLIYFQIPKVLVLGEKYKSMKPNALKLYMVLFDRMKLSMTHDWKDSEGRYYVRMSQEGAAEIFGWSPTTFRSMKKELEKYGLLHQKQLGQGKTNLLYILKCEYDEKDIYVINKIVDTEMEENERKAENIDSEQKNNFCSPEDSEQKNKSCPPRRTKVDLLEEQKLTTINTNTRENDFNDFSSSSSSRDDIDQNLREEFPNVPFDEVKEKVLEDETLVIDTDRQYKSILRYRLSVWKPAPVKPTRTYNKKPRMENVPGWMKEREKEMQQNATPTAKNNELSPEDVKAALDKINSLSEM